MNKELVNEYISEAIRRVIQENNEDYRDISQKIDMSYGYFRQLMAGNKNFMPSKIYEIARIEQVPVNKLFPPIKDTKKGFQNYKEVTGDKSKNDFEKFLKEINV